MSAEESQQRHQKLKDCLFRGGKADTAPREHDILRAMLDARHPDHTTVASAGLDTRSGSIGRVQERQYDPARSCTAGKKDSGLPTADDTLRDLVQEATRREPY